MTVTSKQYRWCSFAESKTHLAIHPSQPERLPVGLIIPPLSSLPTERINFGFEWVSGASPNVEEVRSVLPKGKDDTHGEGIAALSQPKNFSAIL